MPFTINQQDLFPKLAPDEVSPFGGILSKAIANRLAMAKAQEAEAAAPYGGLSKLAQILSQSAYAQAVMPQIATKAAGTSQVWSQLSDDQKRALATGATTPITGSNVAGVPAQQGNQFAPLISQAMQIYQEQNKPKPGVFESLKNFLTRQQTPQQNIPISQQLLGQNEGQPNAVNQGQVQPTVVNPSQENAQPTLSPTEQENTYLKQKKKQEQLGTEEAKQQAEYGPAAQGVIAQQKSLDSLNSIYNEPAIKKIADVPFATKHSISWYKQTGNKEERDAAGRMEAAENSFIAASFGLFPQRITNNDLIFLQKMKPAENDPLDVRKGKIAEIEKYTKAKAKQIQLADKYMSQGDTQAQAEFKADSEIRADKIRENAEKKYQPKKSENKANINFNPADITAENIMHTAKELKISVPEAIKRIEAKYKIKVGDYIPNAP